MKDRRAGADSDRRAFEACFAMHADEVLRFALRRVGERAAAEDVVAETFATAWRRRADVPERTLPWLYGVAGLVIANQQRSARRRLRLRGRLSHERGQDTRDVAESVAERDAVMQAFARLTDRQREILRLAEWEGLDTEDGAQVLGCTPAAFRVRLHRARAALAKQLDPSGHVEAMKNDIGKPMTRVEESR